MNKFEKKIVIMFSKPKSKSLDFFSNAVSNVPFLVVFWIVVAIGLIIYDTLVGIYICIGLAIVFVIHFVVSEGIFKWGGKKFSLEKIRPYRKYPNEIKSIGKKFSDSSFPSSHVAAMVGGLSVLVNFFVYLWPAAIAFVLIMSWSRLRNGMHYPSDILAGIALGLLYGYFAILFLRII